MPRTLLEQVVKEDVKEATAQVLTRGLVRKVVTPNGIRYEITDAGWQFVKEYEEITAELEGDASNTVADSSGASTTGAGLLSAPLQKRPELIEFLSDPAGLHLQYEVMKPEIGVLVPTLNEVNTIGNMLKEIPKHVQYHSEVLVIDASDDETSLVARKYGAKVLRQRGQGKGNALRQAFCALGSDIVVMMDGDGCMQAEEIPRFVKAIVYGADMAKGSRFLKNGGSQDLSFIRKVGNLFFVTLVNLLWSGKYTDLCYGFLAFRREALERLKPYLKSDHFQIETEICIRANKLGLKVVEVPSVELKRSHGKSKLSGIRASLQILQVILHEFVSRA